MRTYNFTKIVFHNENFCSAEQLFSRIHVNTCFYKSSLSETLPIHFPIPLITVNLTIALKCIPWTSLWVLNIVICYAHIILFTLSNLQTWNNGKAETTYNVQTDDYLAIIIRNSQTGRLVTYNWYIFWLVTHRLATPRHFRITRYFYIGFSLTCVLFWNQVKWR